MGELANHGAIGKRRFRQEANAIAALVLGRTLGFVRVFLLFKVLLNAVQLLTGVGELSAYQDENSRHPEKPEIFAAGIHQSSRIGKERRVVKIQRGIG
jgi:hypothetical protein